MSEIYNPNPEDQQLKVVIVDISEHRRQLARDTADARLGSETAAHYQSRGEAFRDWRGFVRRVWKGNVFREYYQQKYYREELQELEQSDNLYAHAGQDDTMAKLAVVDRFATEYDDVIHAHAGESRNTYEADEDIPNNVRQNIRDLISQYVSGALDDEAFEEEKNRVCALSANGDQSRIAGGLLYADNLLEIAQNARAAVDHGQALEDLLDSMKVVTGEAMMGARTEARFNKVDKIVDKLSSSRIGSLLPEATIASAVAIASGFVKYGSQKALATALAVTGALGITGGVLGALRESKRIKQERAQHMRERAIGQEFEPGARRRSAMEETKYETVSARSLADLLDTIAVDDQMSADEYISATSQIAAISARIRMSDVQKIDLVHFSSLEEAEDERFGLDLALASAKVRMSQFLAGQPPDFLPAGQRTADFSVLLHGHVVAATAEIDRINDEKDRAFRTLKRKEVMKAAGKAFGWGMLLGATVQEGLAHLPGNDSFAGLGESHDGTERTTTLHALIQGREQAPIQGDHQLATQEVGSRSSVQVPEGYSVVTEDNTHTIVDPAGKAVTTLSTNASGRFTPNTLNSAPEHNLSFTTEPTGPGAGLSGQQVDVALLSDANPNTLRIPSEYGATVTGSDTGSLYVDITDQNGANVANIRLNADGTMTPDAIEALEGAGLKVENSVTTIGTTETITGASPEEVLWTTADEAENVRRTLWYGNDTPGVFDKNELRAHAGGVNGEWFDAQGNVVIDVTAMRPDWSYWEGQSANPWDLAGQGKLRAGISLSKGTQDFVYDFEFSQTPEGRLVAVIPPDSPAHQLFEAGNHENGHGDFNGRYIEIMEFTGESDANGAEKVNMLATYVGDNDAENLTTIVDTTKEVHTATITAPIESREILTFVPPVETVTAQEVTPIVPIPIFARKGLERAREQRRYGYYGYMSPENLQDLREEVSPTLIQDPGAILNPGAELTRYRRLITRKRGRRYVQSIDTAIANSPALSSIGPQTKAIVAIPVGATVEADNIYHTLATYAKQSPEALSATAFLLHVNWINDAEADPDKKAAIDKTLSEIERAQADFPDLKIGTITTVWDRADVDRDGGVIGHVARKLYDTAMMCTERAISEGRIDSSHDVLIIRNDADAKGLSRNYLKNMIDAADEQDTTDAFVGGLRWETDRHEDFPGFGVASNFNEVLYANSARRGRNTRIRTRGANTAIRASTFAAVGGVGFGSYVGAASDDLEIGSRLYAARSGRLGTRRGTRYRIRGRRYSPDAFQENQPPIAYVRGAQVDTVASRLLNEYRLGRSISRAWDRFEGRDRDASSADPSLIGPEGEVLRDIDSVARRIELNISDSATLSAHDPAAVQASLRFIFPERIPRGKYKGESVYRLSWSRGKCHFEFTPAGKDWLKRSLERNAKGQIDPFGNRVRRKQYGEVKDTAKIRPKTTQAKMVRA